ncbi:MAG: DUF177 domain-containing protein [Dethiosulfatibacter sp.]|nr:DUF177 domain-containing protein [Dethiosulfatibacter sp.]
MIINLKDFLNSKEIHAQYNLNIDINSLDLDDTIRLIEDVECSVSVYKTDDNLYAEVNLSYKYGDNCARCNEVLENRITTNFNVTINGSTEEDDLNVELVNDKIDLTDLIKQSIYLSKPLKVLCKADCKGICIKCGSNNNYDECDCNDETIDPRLESLVKLLDKEV